MKRFSFRQITYKWVLLVSIAIFFITYLIDLLSPHEKPVSLFVFGSVIATLVAAIWAILNYVKHLQVNPLYKNFSGSSKRQPIFQVLDHQYLFFWGSVAVLLGVIIFIATYTYSPIRVPWLVDVGVTAVCYGVGFYLSFFMYLLLDRLLSRKN